MKHAVVLSLVFSIFSLLPPRTASSVPVLQSDALAINAKDETGLTVLMQVAWDGNPGGVKKLLQAGADPKIADQYGWTALNYALATDHADVAKALIAGGSPVNTSDRRGITPLMWAAFSGKSELVSVLLAGGAEINAVDSKGATAYSIATAQGHGSIAKALVKAGGVGPSIDKAALPVVLAPVDRDPKVLNGHDISQAFFQEARKTKPRGIISLRLQIGIDGKVKQVKVTKRMSEPLTEAAVRIAFRIQATPAEVGGKPVEYWYAFRFWMG